MDKDNETPSGVRLLLGLLAGALIGAAMGQGVDLVSTPVSIMAASLSVLFGFISTYLLKEAVPRREKPSILGTIALLLMLACYLVIGRIVVYSCGVPCIAMYAAAGIILLWLVFTSIAEASLLSAFGIGGFCGGFGGILVPWIFKMSFSPLMDCLNGNASGETLVYTCLALICTIPGAVAAVAGRMSGWGLLDHTKENVWAFNSDGRLYVKQMTR